MRRVALAIPEYLLDPLAQYLEWIATLKLLPPAMTEPRRRVVLAGMTSLTERLLASPLFEGHVLSAVIAACTKHEVFAPGHGFIPVIAPERAHEIPTDVMVITDQALSWLGAATSSRAVELPCYDRCRQARYFDDPVREVVPHPFQRLRDKAWHALEAVFKPGRTILFAGVSAYFNFSRLSLSLRRRGWITAFLCLNPSNTRHKDGHFDAVVDAGGDAELFFRLLGAFPFTAVHFQGWCTNHSFAAAAAELATCPLVVEFNDVPQYLLDPDPFDAAFGHGMYAMEERAIGVILEKAHAVVFNTTPGGGAPLLKRYASEAKILHFNSFPSPDFFTRAEAPQGQNPIKLVFAGLVNSSNLPESVFGDVKLIRLIPRLTAQGLDYHLFPNPYQSIDPSGPLQDYVHLASQDPNFFLHQGLPPHEIVPALARMHYGSMLYDFPTNFQIKRDHLSLMLPTKFFTYMEAGLPVLVSRELEGVARIVEENNLGLAVSQDELASLGERLERADWTAMHRSVLAYREANSMDHNIDRLLDVYARGR